MTIGHKIQKIRTIKGYSQEYVASKLAITQQHYSKIETDQTPLTLQRLEQVTTILDVPPMSIINHETDKIVFQNSSHDQSTQEGFVFQGNNIEEQRKLYERLLAEKDKLLAEKDRIIEFLTKK